MLLIWPFNQLIPLAFLVVAGDLAGFLAGMALAVVVILGAVRWWRFTWQLDERALVIERGLLSRRRRVIPVDRIQSVDLVRKLRHRILGVVEVRVEAVGGSETEGKLDALSQGEAERLRVALLAAREGRSRANSDADADADAAEKDRSPRGEQLVALAPGQLVLAGLTGGRVGVVAALLGAAQQLFGDRLDPLFSRFGELPDLFSPAGLVTLAVAVLLLSFLLSIAATTVAYWGFRLERDGDELRVRRGLLEQRLETLPLRRVQALRIEENLPRRALGLAAVKVDVAGKSGGQDARDTGLLLPIGSRRDAHALVATLLGQPGLESVTLAAMPRAALRRRLVRAVLATVPPLAAATILLGPIGLLAGLLGLPAAWAAIDSYRNLGSGELEGVVIGRFGVLVRRTAYVPVRSLQSLALTASPFQRRAGLATLELQIPRSPGMWGGPELRDLASGDGERLLARLAAALTPPRISAGAPPG